MIPESDPDTTVRRFDLSQQFTAMQRISVVLSRATEASKTLQEVLTVLHNDAFMQHGMICLYDSEQEILSIEALQQTGQQPLPGSTQIRHRPGEGLVGTVLACGQSLVLPRVADDQRFLDRLSLYDYDLPFIAVPLMGPNARPIGCWRPSRWRARRAAAGLHPFSRNRRQPRRPDHPADDPSGLTRPVEPPAAEGGTAAGLLVVARRGP